MAPAAASNGTLAMRSGPARRRRALGVIVAITNVVTRVFFPHTYLRCVSADRPMRLVFLKMPRAPRARSVGASSFGCAWR